MAEIGVQPLQYTPPKITYEDPMKSLYSVMHMMRMFSKPGPTAAQMFKKNVPPGTTLKTDPWGETYVVLGANSKEQDKSIARHNRKKTQVLIQQSPELKAMLDSLNVYQQETPEGIKTATWDELDIDRKRQQLRQWQQEVLPKLAEAGFFDQKILEDLYVKPKQNEIVALQKKIGEDSGLWNAFTHGLGNAWDSAKATVAGVAPEFLGGDSPQERIARATQEAEEEAQYRANNAAIQNDMKRKALGDSAWSRLSARDALEFIGEQVPSLALLMAGGWGGAALGSRLVGGMAGRLGGMVAGTAPISGAMESQHYVSELANDPNLTDEQKVQAYQDGNAAAAALGFGTGTAFALLPQTRLLGAMMRTRAAENAVARLGGDATANAVLRQQAREAMQRTLQAEASPGLGRSIVGNAALAGGISAADQAGMNAIMNANAGTDRELSEGIGEAALSGAISGGVLGGITGGYHMLRGQGRQEMAPTAEPAKPAEPRAEGSQSQPVVDLTASPQEKTQTKNAQPLPADSPLKLIPDEMGNADSERVYSAYTEFGFADMDAAIKNYLGKSDLSQEVKNLIKQQHSDYTAEIRNTVRDLVKKGDKLTTADIETALENLEQDLGFMLNDIDLTAALSKGKLRPSTNKAVRNIIKAAKDRENARVQRLADEAAQQSEPSTRSAAELEDPVEPQTRSVAELEDPVPQDLFTPINETLRGETPTPEVLAKKLADAGIFTPYDENVELSLAAMFPTERVENAEKLQRFVQEAFRIRDEQYGQSNGSAGTPEATPVAEPGGQGTSSAPGESAGTPGDQPRNPTGSPTEPASEPVAALDEANAGNTGARTGGEPQSQQRPGEISNEANAPAEPGTAAGSNQRPGSPESPATNAEPNTGAGGAAGTGEGGTVESGVQGTTSQKPSQYGDLTPEQSAAYDEMLARLRAKPEEDLATQAFRSRINGAFNRMFGLEQDVKTTKESFRATFNKIIEDYKRC